MNWALYQYQSKRDEWKASFLKGRNRCNEFVAYSHIFGDPDVSDYPEVLRNNGYFLPTVADLSDSSNNGYTIPNVSDLADPRFEPSRLGYLPVSQAQAGDIIVWYGGGTHHSALYIGNGQVIYQHKVLGLKMNTVQGTTKNLKFKGKPVVRRYRY